MSTAQTAPAGRRSRPPGRAALTGEQLAILDASATGETVAICAGAGTGKTATLRMIAAAKPNSRMLYVAYNRAVRIEAEATFPQNVTCKTAHALAYRQFGAPIADRLSGPRLTARQNAQALSITQPFGLDATTIFEPASLATMALHTVARFCRSADRHITASHFAPPEGLDASQSEALAAQVLPQAQRAWDDLSRGPKGRLKPTHDVYLKQWQLSEPELSGWDVILYDFTARGSQVVHVCAGARRVCGIHPGRTHVRYSRECARSGRDGECGTGSWRFSGAGGQSRSGPAFVRDHRGERLCGASSGRQVPGSFR